MGKSNKKKRKRSLSSDSKGAASSPHEPVDEIGTSNMNGKVHNPLLERQEQFMNQKGLTDQERYELFSPSISNERRAELWMAQADLGEDMVNRYAWATPDATAIRIIKEFSPLVEIGCGSNAYWCRILRQAGVDIVGYDINISSGGKIDGSAKKKTRTGDTHSHPSYLKQGGPEILASEEIQKSGRNLFLCYPDEDDGDAAQLQVADELPTSMGWRCLNHYSGQYVIHVGEIFLDANLSMDQAPWGRSSAPEFQQRLASEYHCLLKVELPNWFHTRDVLTVWKRSTISTMVFVADDEDEDEEDEEVEYRHIPRSERLPVNIAAPCLAHLLPVSSGKVGPTTPSSTSKANLETSTKATTSTPAGSNEKFSKLGDPVSSNNSKKKKKKKKRQNGDGVSSESKVDNSYDWGEVEDTDGEDATPW